MTLTCDGPGRRDCACPRAKHAHGTRGAYLRDGCRGFACRIAASEGLLAWRHGQPGGASDDGMWVPACGVIRRLQALHRIGWTTGDLAQQLGITYDAVRNARTYKSSRRSAWLAARVADLYDELWDQRPVARNRGHAAMISKTINMAVRAGWAPPMWWDDDRIDQPSAVPESGLLGHGTHAAFNRHKTRNEHPCARCRAGEREYQAERHRRRRAVAEAAA